MVEEVTERRYEGQRDYDLQTKDFKAKIYIESKSLTVQMVCLPEAFRLSPSSEVFYFKK